MRVSQSGPSRTGRLQIRPLDRRGLLADSVIGTRVAAMGEAQEPGGGWLEGRAHVFPVRVYYEDTDFSGVVYHANYLRFMERGRSEFLRLVGAGHGGMLGSPEPLVWAVRRMNVDFLKPARMEDALTVRTEVLE